MNTFNIKEAAEQLLRMLEQNGTSAKMLKEYRCTGFGAIIRYFSQRSAFDVNAEMVNAFVLEQREKFERGEFSE